MFTLSVAACSTLFVPAARSQSRFSIERSTLSGKLLKQIEAGLHFRQAVAAKLFDQRRKRFRRPPRFPRSRWPPTPRRRRSARSSASSGCLVARLTDASGLRSVLIGFLAARITSGCPLVMPASKPPALFVGRV